MSRYDHPAYRTFQPRTRAHYIEYAERAEAARARSAAAQARGAAMSGALRAAGSEPQHGLPQIRRVWLLIVTLAALAVGIHMCAPDHESSVWCAEKFCEVNP